MKIYVAAKFEEKLIVRGIYDFLRTDGHEITHDWTDEEDAVGERRATDCAIADIQGVLAADALLLLTHPKARGSYVELGVALGASKPVVVLGDRHLSIFLAHPLCVCLETLGQARAWLQSAGA